MKEILEHIYNQNIDRITDDRISFGCNYFDIVFELSDEIEEETLDKLDENPPISEIDFSSFSNNSLCDMFLRDYTYIEDYRDGEAKQYYIEDSITFQLFELLRNIKNIYPDAILNYNLGSLYVEDRCEGWGCPDYGWYYGFEIQINNKYWNDLDFYNFLKNLKRNNLGIDISNFYNIGKGLKDSFELKILNSNTKNRRLGYLKILLRMFNEQTIIPISKLNTKFEKYCQDYNSYLEKHKNQKGNVVVTKTGYSANPYIELAVSLGLIRKASGIYQIGKIGKVYNILKGKIDEQNSNPFIFSKFDTVFFLELLLKEDYWFLYAIMEQAAITPNITYKNLKKEFKQVLLTQVGQFIGDAQDNKILPLKIIERRINNWKKPEVYMEHVLMPRLNWLYDMEFIELKSDLSFNLTEIGKKLLYNLAFWNDIALHKLVSPVSFIDNYFMKMINSVFDLKKQTYTNDADHEFDECLEDSFVLFKTLASNRITFSLFVPYTKHISFWNNSIIVDTEDLKKAFELRKFPNCIFKYQEHYKDGYIQKINKQ